MAEWSVTGTERDVLLAAKQYLPGPAAATRRCRWRGSGHAANRTEAVARAGEPNLIL
jgi:hypothetical protein